ncbi:MAG: tetratricopeptide repeat protein [Cyanobacteria bacterium P01_F01_bin.53]
MHNSKMQYLVRSTIAIVLAIGLILGDWSWCGLNRLAGNSYLGYSRVLAASLVTVPLPKSPLVATAQKTLTQGMSAAEIKTISDLRETAFEATRAGQFDLAELQWTALIEKLPEEGAVWSNRGSVRVRLNDLDGAMADYTQAIQLAPNEPDPYLNRGAVWEAMGQWDKAIKDYNRVLQLNPDDPAAYNNRGNAEAGAGDWELAIADYQASITLQPSFSLGYGNYALALYQTGETDRAIQIMKSLVRKYPSFTDMRAALTAALWVQGKGGEAESNWVAVVGLDSRYKDLNWVQNVRRWPPKMVNALESFLTL